MTHRHISASERKAQSREERHLETAFRRAGFLIRYAYDWQGYVSQVLVCPTTSNLDFVLIGESLAEARHALNAISSKADLTAEEFFAYFPIANAEAKAQEGGE